MGRESESYIVQQMMTITTSRCFCAASFRAKNELKTPGLIFSDDFWLYSDNTEFTTAVSCLMFYYKIKLN